MADLRPIFIHIAPAIMVLARLSGLFIYAPILSSSAIPMKFKGYLAVSMTLILYPALLPQLQATGSFPLENLDLWTLAPMFVLEMLIGLIIGLIASLPLVAVQLGGQTVGQQLGLALARTSDPTTDVQSTVIGQFLYFIAIAAFLSIGGLEILISILIRTFDHIPIGGYHPTESVMSMFVYILQSSFELSIRIALPVLCIIFMQTLALGFINKTAPAFNILSLGFPLRVMVGLATLIIILDIVDESALNELFNTLEGLANYFNPPIPQQ